MISPSGSAGSGPTNAITTTKTRMKMMPPRTPARPPTVGRVYPHLFLSRASPTFVWRVSLDLVLRVISSFTSGGYSARGSVPRTACSRRRATKRVPLVLQILLAAVFAIAGSTKLLQPYDKLRANPQMAWVGDFSPGTVKAPRAREHACPPDFCAWRSRPLWHGRVQKGWNDRHQQIGALHQRHVHRTREHGEL